MNFKLTKLKTIISIIVGLIVGIYLSMKVYYIGNYEAPYVISIDFTIYFSIGLIVILTYIIWSLIQKN